MDSMFYNCTSFSQSIRGWEVQPGCTFTNMFTGATGMSVRFGDAASPEYTEHYGSTPAIEFFNHTPIKVSIHIKDTSTDVADSYNYLQLSEISFYDENDQQIDVLSHEKPSENLDGTPNNVGENSPNEGI